MDSLRATAPVPVKERSILESHLGEIESRLKGLAEVDQRVSMAISRLINPRPTDVGQTQSDAPTPVTIEGRLQSIVRQFDGILARLNDSAGTLDQAI